MFAWGIIYLFFYKNSVSTFNKDTPEVKNIVFTIWISSTRHLNVKCLNPARQVFYQWLDYEKEALVSTFLRIFKG